PLLASNPDTSLRTRFSLRSLQDLALLEASRLEETGDMTGAWYRAALRTSYHLGLRATIVGRMIAQRGDGEFRRRLSLWLSDRRTTPALIRRALDDVIACGDVVPSDSYTLKVEYLSLEGTLSDPDKPGFQRFMAILNAKLQTLGYELDLDQKRAIA